MSLTETVALAFAAMAVLVVGVLILAPLRMSGLVSREEDDGLIPQPAWHATPPPGWWVDGRLLLIDAETAARQRATGLTVYAATRAEVRAKYGPYLRDGSLIDTRTDNTPKDA